ncbi:YHS domain-containing protein [Desulfobaculum xiamenense]|uniref:YHS domain-containing protein n=1 Tax=Desulfobaculum xiamenense TaxID=995050 RepID=A0A846QDL6_9BACT|nr:transcriptional regulator [Desulfobaculum xiamenense]NJB66816.1 YHS domain-containing protein [Desulfobaculum xiamenense]
MLKIIVPIVCAFLLFKMLKGDQKKKVAKENKDMERMAETGETVKDPVCGAYVPHDASIRVKDADGVHCFCSYECRDAYLRRLESVDVTNE